MLIIRASRRIWPLATEKRSHGLDHGLEQDPEEEQLEGTQDEASGKRRRRNRPVRGVILRRWTSYRIYARGRAALDNARSEVAQVTRSL